MNNVIKFVVLEKADAPFQAVAAPIEEAKVDGLIPAKNPAFSIITSTPPRVVEPAVVEEAKWDAPVAPVVAEAPQVEKEHVVAQIGEARAQPPVEEAKVDSLVDSPVDLHNAKIVEVHHY